ncbi:MAG: SH3 domain-containing protein [Paracoccus sp. (in: a-proteobacteria)]|uniref:SH3 domain-containing protein n=1 Tax=Paracoccus sp. TaxID=267 RepID=UPI0039E537E8
MRTHLAALLALMIVAGCAASHGSVVKGAGPDDLLKLREGPGLNYRIILGLPDGTRLRRHDCVTKAGKLWCRVSLAAKPGVSGYVSADYLSDS